MCGTTGNSGQNQAQPNSPQKDDKNDDKKSNAAMSVGPLHLQSSQLEESNFKDQFFVTRSSFQVNII